ncbi:hydrogenase expression/formation protein HypD [Desulfocicer vacuolatum DSM 3385]|uniref:Hydrogenase expression/formation protein HypD n=1 Tax=Desulfocicer vacuolatum DSM 3385 TaxID=1121400 RepID=A0A1W1YN50_9BACT|nr:hydrogenase formation protein HypD [Desulfocicer vacuolatum]SMC37650.1 hydrogenase expression/formation protein HypD [Desulfocicer vacuolatum DSM 3385]
MALKYVQEYRDGELARQLIAAIGDIEGKKMRLMEVCGTHTMSIFRHGIPSVLPDSITLLTGPGCPVCVTAQRDIDIFVALSMVPEVILTSFGDLMRVPGTLSSLQQEKARGRDIRVVYSAFDAVKLAAENPHRQVVFCAVGFETTTPTVAASIMVAQQQGLTNFSIHCAHKLTPPALAALMETPGVEIDGFLLPGHVSVITGTGAYLPVFDQYKIPAVIAGFEPVDILKAVLMLVRQNVSGVPALENAYPRAVCDKGNPKALAVMDQVFKKADTVWRGIGMIPASGLVLREGFNRFNALEKFDIQAGDAPEPAGCACGDILMGLKKPDQCKLYKKRCTPMNPVGPCMVSSEGACAAFYRYG